MQIPLVMTLIGPDRTGLVESVARAVAGHGGNWLESRMCRLGGEFAGILRIEIPAEKKSPLLAALQKIPGLTVVVQPGSETGSGDAGPAGEAGNRRQRPAGHRPRNHQRARPRGRERRGIFQRSRQRADVRRNLVQGRRAIAIARRLQSRRVEKGFGKNRRRFAGGCFVGRIRRRVKSCQATEGTRLLSARMSASLADSNHSAPDQSNEIFATDGFAFPVRVHRAGTDAQLGLRQRHRHSQAGNRHRRQTALPLSGHGGRHLSG